VIIRAIGWTTLPLTIFIIGYRVRLTSLRDYKPLVWCLVLRMLILPALVFLALNMLGKGGLPYQVTIMSSAMPPALTTSILALEYRLDNDLAVACISVGTILSMFLLAAAMIIR